jgi:hypothetical protein
MVVLSLWKLVLKEPRNRAHSSSLSGNFHIDRRLAESSISVFSQATIGRCSLITPSPHHRRVPQA